MDPFSIEKVWVNLSLSKGRSNLSGDYLNMLKEAYDGHQFAQLIGHPGEGKTMTMKRLAYDWATGRLKNYDLVFCVPLREIEEESKTILDMALTYMQSYNVLKEADVEYLQSIKDHMVGEQKKEDNPSSLLHILIILDGYDEFSSDVQCQELRQLLYKCDLRNLDCCVLLTTRPHAVEDVSAPVSTLKIEPLDEEQQRAYMFQHFEQELSSDDVTDRVEKLEDLLSENPCLEEVAKTPLLLCFICILCDVLTPTDDAVQLYKLLFNAMIDRYEPAGIRRSMRGIFKEPFQNICGKSELIYNLGEMALSGLVGNTRHTPDKLQFTQGDLDIFEIDRDYCVRVGFLNFQLQGRLNEKIYEFPHKTTQEFFAALLLFHQLSKCEEIEIYQDTTCPKIKNLHHHFLHHPLLKQVFNTTKYDELYQLFCFLLEMSADYYKNNTQSSTHPVPFDFSSLEWCVSGSQEVQNKSVSNTIHFFLAWIGRNRNRAYNLYPMFRPLLKHLSNCSQEANLCYQLRIICHQMYDSQRLLWNFSTCNISLVRVYDVCIYASDLQIIFIPDQSLIDKNLRCHAVPVPYEQFKMKCDGQFSMCLVDSTALQKLHQVCKETDCRKIEIVTINISSAITHSINLSLEQKLQVDSLNFNFEKTVESPFDLTPIWNSCISLFTNIRVIRIGPLGVNNIQVIGMDQIFGHTDIRNSVRIICLTDTTFPNEQTVCLLAEQLKQLKSLIRFTIVSSQLDSIGEQYMFMLLDSVMEAGIPYLNLLTIRDFCLEQRETFKKLCFRLEQWDHVRILRLEGFQSSNIDLLCNTVSNLAHLEQLDVWKVNKECVNRLEEASPKLMVTNHHYR